MDEQNETAENKPVAAQEAPDDLQQLNRWVAEYGRPALVGLLVAVVALLGWTIWNNQRKAKAEAAVQALFRARAPEEFQQMALADSRSPTAPLAQASAAAEFYAQGRYDEALKAYEQFLGQYADHMLAPHAAVGVAASLEALDDFEGAALAYEAFAGGNAESPLMPQAVLGAARCREQLEQWDAARALYEDFIVAHPESPWVAQAESGLLFLKKAERAREMSSTVPAVAAAESAPGEGEAEAVVAEASEEGGEVVVEAKPKKNARKKKKAEAALDEAAPVKAEEPASEG